MGYQEHSIFIIHPSRKIRNDIVWTLRLWNFESFGLEKPDIQVMAHHQNIVIFLYALDQKNWNWRTYAREILRQDVVPPLVALGPKTPPEGFAAAVNGTEKEILDAISRYLKDSKIQGRRRYVRFGNRYSSIATFEFHNESRRYAGVLRDISMFGMTCLFQPEPASLNIIAVPEIRVNLSGYNFFLSGHFAIERVVSDWKFHIFFFDLPLERRIQNSIDRFIYDNSFSLF